MRQWLVDARNMKGMKQKKVAELVHIAQASYCNMEKGKISPKPATAKRIAAVLDIDWTRFYEDSGKD